MEETKSEQFQLDKELTLYTNTQSNLTVNTSSLSLTKQNNQIIECCITFSVSPELYQLIDTEELFNLKPEVRGPLSNSDFLPEPDIEIEVTLKPDLLPHLLEKVSNAEEAAGYLLRLNEQQLDTSQKPEPLLETESWLCLKVKQLQESGETGYTTFWYHVNPSTFNAEDASTEQMSESIVNFFKQWTEANLAEATKDATSEFLDGIASIFQELVDESFQEKDEDTDTRESIFAAMVNFFSEDDWHFVKVEGKSAVRLGFQGENGRWRCWAQAKEEEQQFIFYSICPINAPENKLMEIAEFITRANYGIILGNFELDFSDGDIRYKTTIDVEGDRLRYPLIKQIVYTNVMMMDQYLPGIMAIIEGNTSPVKAIAQVEG